jgi:hypothetical protein
MKYKQEYIGRQFKKVYDDGVYVLKPLGLQRVGKKHITYNLKDSIQRIENGEFILILEHKSKRTKKVYDFHFDDSKTYDIYYGKHFLKKIQEMNIFYHKMA